MRENSRRNVQVNLLNQDKKGLQVNLSIKRKKLAMNLWNTDKRDWQSNVSIRKKKMQMNLLKVDKETGKATRVSEGKNCK